MNKLLIAMAGMICALAGAADAKERPMSITGATSQPIGHYEFCQRYRDECQRNDDVRPIKLTRAAWAKIVEVNAAVNASIFPRTDDDLYGKPEYWAYPKTEGDCEDFALLKQYMLERAGFPRGALLLTVARQANGDGHAVLTVRTDGGDFILDNLEERVLGWEQTSLHFLKRQSERDSGKWAGISDDRDVLVGSVR